MMPLSVMSFNIKEPVFSTGQIEDKVLRTQVSKGFSFCKVV